MFRTYTLNKCTGNEDSVGCYVENITRDNFASAFKTIITVLEFNHILPSWYQLDTYPMYDESIKQVVDGVNRLTVGGERYE